jgi:hypothetical protein
MALKKRQSWRESKRRRQEKKRNIVSRIYDIQGISGSAKWKNKLGIIKMVTIKTGI